MSANMKSKSWLFTGFSILIISFYGGIIDGQTCHKQCSSCVAGVCTECYYGYWGPTCAKPCVDCWFGGCDKNSGRCIQCTPGRHAEDCNKPCPHNCRPSYDNVKNCDRDTGTCLEGCIKGWWGQRCEKGCGQGCSEESCYQNSGKCVTVECKKGWFGPKCDRECDNCLNGICKNDSCADGCKDGWAGEKCIERCGLNCERCDQLTRACFHCANGLYGPECELECPLTCRRNICNMSGQCVMGCVRGFHGLSCKTTCPFNCLECEQASDVCTRCKIGFAGPSCSPITTTSQRSVPNAHQTERKTEESESETGISSTKATNTDLFTLTSVVFLGIVLRCLTSFWNN